MGQRSSVHLPLCMARFKGLALMFDGKNKNNGVQRATLDDLHIIMCMPIKQGESIEAFMAYGGTKIIESFHTTFI
jgi:hypothetical protein